MTLSIHWSTQTVDANDAGDLVSVSREHELRFDAVTKEVQEWAGVSTEHPVEGGTSSDHKTPQQDIITLEVRVTNQPLDVPPPSGFVRRNVVTTLDTKTVRGMTVQGYSKAFDRVADVSDTLYRLAREPILVTVATRFRTYESVSIERVVWPRTKPSDVHTFNIDLKRITVVSTRQVEAPESREARGQSETDSGAQEGQEATSDPGAESMAHRANEAFQEDGLAGVLGLFS